MPPSLRINTDLDLRKQTPGDQKKYLLLHTKNTAFASFSCLYAIGKLRILETKPSEEVWYAKSICSH
ncbi:MAG TPA: hypothetical protein VJ508_19390, partial [Saprospiraceae bacterium]|nr:hypothetical protein [Saprospiraceae bacterium]